MSIAQQLEEIAAEERVELTMLAIINRNLIRLERMVEALGAQNMATLEEAKNDILAAIATATAAMQSAIADLRAGAAAQAVADALEAAVAPLNDASAALTAAYPTP